MNDSIIFEELFSHVIQFMYSDYLANDHLVKAIYLRSPAGFQLFLTQISSVKAREGHCQFSPSSAKNKWV